MSGIVNAPTPPPLPLYEKPSHAFLIQAYISTLYRSFISFWPLKNLAWLANGPFLYVGWQGQDICVVSSTIGVAVQITRL
jgi:hypothetical protein